jgi:flagellar motor protein MotB
MISGVALICGITIFVFGIKNKSGWVQAAGIGTIAVSLLTHFSIVREIKFGDLIKLEKPSLSLSLPVEIEKLDGFGPQRLTALENFPSGEATMDGGMQRTIKCEVCNVWSEGVKVGRNGVILVIGSTDRVPLSPANRHRYESNVGLARARAENVKEEIIRCGVPEEKLISLVTGPRHTPEKEQQSERSTEFGGDRRVDVWAFWSLPEGNKDQKGAQRK